MHRLRRSIVSVETALAKSMWVARCRFFLYGDGHENILLSLIVSPFPL